MGHTEFERTLAFMESPTRALKDTPPRVEEEMLSPGIRLSWLPGLLDHQTHKSISTTYLLCFVCVGKGLMDGPLWTYGPPASEKFASYMVCAGFPRGRDSF